MQTRSDRSLLILGLVAVTLVVTTCKGDAGALGPSGPTGPTGPTGPGGATGPVGPAAAFKTVKSTTFVFPAATGVTNVLRLDFTTPATGFVYASGSGYCNATVAGASEWRYVIGTTATEGWSLPLPVWRFSGATTATAFPVSVDRVLPVVAGANSIFLNVDNASGGALTSCSGVLTASFTTTQLP